MTAGLEKMLQPQEARNHLIERHRTGPRLDDTGYGGRQSLFGGIKQFFKHLFAGAQADILDFHFMWFMPGKAYQAFREIYDLDGIAHVENEDRSPVGFCLQGTGAALQNEL